MVETKSATSSEILSTEKKRNGFHGKYLEVCKSKNLMPVPEVKAKQRNIQVLDFHADRVKSCDWIAICRSLFNDKSLKFIAIRLRKNSELVLDEIDTFKKATSVVNHPVIYSKFLFTELVESLQNLMSKSSMLETIIIEGFPLYGRYMSTFSKGLANNKSLKTLNLSRSKIGDDACDSLCETIKHIMNIETVNFSGCNLSVKGAASVANLIKHQKIQRFSEAWMQSLRYQNVDPELFPGLRKILLNNNPEVGDKGLQLLTDALLEDVWIKDVEVQNCGIGDEGAQDIIKCLNVNKTILNFNISGNFDVSEHFHRHILVNLGNSDHDSSDSTDSKSSTGPLTKAKLLEKVKYLEEQLEAEIFRRKQSELLNEKLNMLQVEFHKQHNLQASFRIPEGFTLVANDTFEDMLKEKLAVSKVPSARAFRHRRKRGNGVLSGVKSCMISKPSFGIQQISKSEVLMKPATVPQKTPYIERNIGDHATAQQETEAVSNISTPLMTAAELLQTFVKKKENGQVCESSSDMLINFDPRSIFKKSSLLVPYNSDAEACDD